MTESGAVNLFHPPCKILASHNLLQQQKHSCKSSDNIQADNDRQATHHKPLNFTKVLQTDRSYLHFFF